MCTWLLGIVLCRLWKRNRKHR